MSATVWFNAPLHCLNCGTPHPSDTDLHTQGLNDVGIDRYVAVGDVLPITIEDFEDAYLTLRLPREGETVRALERWSCSACNRTQWAELTFEEAPPSGYRFSGASTVPLEPEVVRSMHFISRMIDLWIAANPGAETDRLLAVIGHLLP
jgi:hypothetical protein